MEKTHQSQPRIQAPTVTSRLIRLNELLTVYYPVSKSKLYDDIKKGRFPAPVKLGERVSAWRLDSVLAAIEKAAA